MAAGVSVDWGALMPPHVLVLPREVRDRLRTIYVESDLRNFRTVKMPEYMIQKIAVGLREAREWLQPFSQQWHQMHTNLTTSITEAADRIAAMEAEVKGFCAHTTAENVQADDLNHAMWVERQILLEGHMTLHLIIQLALSVLLISYGVELHIP